MNRIILATHGNMSAGVKDTAEMILGNLPNMYAISTTREESVSILQTIKRLLESWPKEDTVYVLTDIIGGSVNNDMISILPQFPQLNIISGMNMSLVLNLAVLAEAPNKDDLTEILMQARKEIINCNDLLKHSVAAKDDEDL